MHPFRTLAKLATVRLHAPLPQNKTFMRDKSKIFDPLNGSLLQGAIPAVTNVTMEMIGEIWMVPGNMVLTPKIEFLIRMMMYPI
jgi:hypothetical protein